MNKDLHESTLDLTTDALALATRVADHMRRDLSRWSAVGDVDGDGHRVLSGATLKRDVDGAEIHVRVGGYRNEGRVTFRAGWPRFRDGTAYVPREYLSIKCSARRAPAALAREIERRLLAAYDPAYREALDYVRASDAAAGEAARAAERLAAAIGAELPKRGSYRQQRNGEAVELLGGPSSAYRIKVTPGYGERSLGVSFEVHNIDEMTARKILTLLGSQGER
jgi:hypothetical protein